MQNRIIESFSTLLNGSNVGERSLNVSSGGITGPPDYSSDPFTSTTQPTDPPPQYDSGEMAWLLACIAITWIMVPGVGFLFSGLSRSKSSLSIIMLCFWSCAVVSIQWYVMGYSLCLSNTGGPFIGNLDHLFLADVLELASVTNPKIPALLVSVWYCLFSVITPTIILGASAERARFLPTVVFIFLWSCLVFDFLTYWTWNPNGWTYKLGALDFGGGTPVHISTGAAALAFAYMLGKREDSTERPPHNMNHVCLGTGFIWLGWLVANAGSGISPNQRAVVVFITTNLSASTGAITWSLLDYYRHGGKWSAVGFCCGAIAGLVAITPASGFVSPGSSLVFGVVGALFCNLCGNVKKYLKVDDAYDVFCCHGIGGIVGNILTGVFAQKSIAELDGTKIPGGWLDGNWIQVVWQLVDTVAGFSWSFIMTAVILFVLDKIPGLKIRATLEDEQVGLDQAELGCHHYDHLEELKNMGMGDTLPSLLSTIPFQPPPLDQENNIKGKNGSFQSTQNL